MASYQVFGVIGASTAIVLVMTLASIVDLALRDRIVLVEVLHLAAVLSFRLGLRGVGRRVTDQRVMTFLPRTMSRPFTCLALIPILVPTTSDARPATACAQACRRITSCKLLSFDLCMDIEQGAD